MDVVNFCFYSAVICNLFLKAFHNQQQTLQPKSLYSSTLPVHSSAQVYNGSHLKQISSQPQIITTQAPGTMFSQAQIFGMFLLISIYEYGQCV